MLDQIKYHMENGCISDGLVKKENLFRGEEDETKSGAPAEKKTLSSVVTPHSYCNFFAYILKMLLYFVYYNICCYLIPFV